MYGQTKMSNLQTTGTLTCFVVELRRVYLRIYNVFVWIFIEGDACYDNVDCTSYEDNVCEAYGAWAQKNCMEFCGVCAKDPSGKIIISVVYWSC